MSAEEIIYPLDYDEKMEEYNQHVKKLLENRDRFLKENPDHHFKNSMYLNVIAPPHKTIIKFIR